jgi:hypothetical protein
MLAEKNGRFFYFAMLADQFLYLNNFCCLLGRIRAGTRRKLRLLSLELLPSSDASGECFFPDYGLGEPLASFLVHAYSPAHRDAVIVCWPSCHGNFLGWGCLDGLCCNLNFCSCECTTTNLFIFPAMAAAALRHLNWYLSLLHMC